MRCARAIAVFVAGLFAGAGLPVLAQSVVSTHSGVVYFFVGSAFLGNEPLQQKFGRFPEIAEGGELRTTLGRAEVLLTPGVFLRIDQNSSIRMLATAFSDTRVELLGGSAIVEVTEQTPNTAVALVYKNWRIRVPQTGVYRIDTEPSAQVRAYRGEVEIAAEGTRNGVTAKEGEIVPLAAVLVPEPSTSGGNDDFKYWATIRSQSISEDNTVAAGILDDPSQIDSAGASSGGYSYFPPTAIPTKEVATPYGLSFWSPYQPTFSSVYFSTFVYAPVFVGSPQRRRLSEFVPGRPWMVPRTG